MNADRKEIHDLDVVQVRNGDVLFLRPKSRLDDGQMKRVMDFVNRWKDRTRAKVDIVLVDHNFEIFVVRPGTGGAAAKFTTED